MKTLGTNASSYYLKTGQAVRTFVHIPDANLLLATQAVTLTDGTFRNSLKQLGTITHTIKPFGGMAEVSGVNLSNLELGQELTFCTEANIEPVGNAFEPTGIAGLVSTGDIAEVYADVRGETSGAVTTSVVSAGQRLTGAGASAAYSTYRTAIQIPIPAGITCEDAAIAFTGGDDYSDTDCEIRIVQGTWASWVGGGIIDDFTGHEPGATSYDATVATGSPQLNETWHTNTHTTDDTNYIRLNRAGRNLIESKAGSYLKIIIMTKRDFDGDAPTGNEYIRMISEGLVLKLRYNTYNIINEEASIYLAFAAAGNSLSTIASVSDMQLVWTGVVDDYSIDERAMNLKLRQNNYKKDMRVPTQLMSLTDYDVLPKDNIGKPAPVVYGQVYTDDYGTHVAGIGVERVGGVRNPVSGVHFYFPSPVLTLGEWSYDNPMVVMVADREIYDAGTAFPAVWLDSLGMFARIWGSIPSDTIDSVHMATVYPMLRYTTDKLGAGFTLTEQFLGIALSIPPSAVYDYSDVTDPEDAYNESGSGSVEFDLASDYAMFVFNDIGAPGEKDKVELVLEMTDGGGIYALGVYAMTKPAYIDVSGSGQSLIVGGSVSTFTDLSAWFTDNGVVDGDRLVVTSGVNEGIWTIDDVTTNIELHIAESMVNVVSQTYYIVASPTTTLRSVESLTGDGQRVVDLTDYSGWDINNLLIKIKPTGNQTFTISNVQLRIFTIPDENFSKIALDKRGIKDDGSGTITGTAGALLEIPAHIIESVGRDIMGLATAEISTGKFDVSATALTSWVMALQIDDRVGTVSLLNDTGEQAKSKVFWDYNDKLSIVTHDNDAGFANAATATPEVPGELDIFDEAAPVTSGSFTRHPILKEGFARQPFEMTCIGTDKVMNDFVLHYFLNIFSGNYERELHITNGAGVTGDVDTNITEASLENSQTLDVLKELVTDSYNEIAATNTWEYEAWAIYDDATANKLIQYYIERLTKNRWIASFSTSLNALAVELGDYINIRHHRVTEVLGTPTSLVQKWEVIKISHDLDSQQITIEAIEV